MSVVCAILGHDWDIDPPWSGKELRYNPGCERCGHAPEGIVIAGSHNGEHRIPERFGAESNE